jgi:hypothetical protein
VGDEFDEELEDGLGVEFGGAAVFESPESEGCVAAAGLFATEFSQPKP